MIAANTQLQERELIKLSSMAAAIAAALGRRGVSGSSAMLAAEAGIAVFKVAFDRWIHEGRRHQLPQFISETIDELRAVSNS